MLGNSPVAERYELVGLAGQKRTLQTGHNTISSPEHGRRRSWRGSRDSHLADDAEPFVHCHVAEHTTGLEQRVGGPGLVCASVYQLDGVGVGRRDGAGRCCAPGEEGQAVCEEGGHATL